MASHHTTALAAACRDLGAALGVVARPAAETGGETLATLLDRLHLHRWLNSAAARGGVRTDAGTKMCGPPSHFCTSDATDALTESRRPAAANQPAMTTLSVPPRPNVSGEYISSAFTGGTTNVPGVVARAM